MTMADPESFQRWLESGGRAIDGLDSSKSIFIAGSMQLGDRSSPQQNWDDEPQDSSGIPPRKRLSCGACETANLGGKSYHA